MALRHERSADNDDDDATAPLLPKAKARSPAKQPDDHHPATHPPSRNTIERI